MRILFLSQWFAPEGSLLKPFVKAFMQRGHSVEVVTGFPNYPAGKVYPGYKIRPWQREILEGIPVFRVPLYPSHDRSAIKRVVNYASFAAAAGSIGVAGARKADVAYVYHPPATVALPALLFRWLRGLPYVYHIQDMWPDTLAATGMFNSAAGLKVIDNWCKAAYRQAEKIAVISPGFKRLLLERGVPAGKIEVIYNWCDEGGIQVNQYNESLARSLGMAGRFNVLFAGTMGMGQALDAVLEAAAALSTRIPEVQFVFIGGGVDVDRLKRKTGELGLTNVKFLERRPIEEIGAVIALADVLLVHLRDDALFEITVPSKTQAYMWAGKPILMGVKGDARALVEQAKAGLSCEPENPQSIAGAVERLHSMPRENLAAMGRNGRTFYEKELALNVAVDKFERIFKNIGVRS